MTTVDFITELFCRVDEQLKHVSKHSQAKLYPSEVVTLALLYALKGSGQRAYWRWLTRDYRACFRTYRRVSACFACSIVIAIWWMHF